jgi:[acyl-carrier-protein] S-malonyltransferase
MSACAFLFPGQGAQLVGMTSGLAEGFPECRTLPARAEEHLGLPLERLMIEGPQQELNEDFVAQVAVYTASCMVVGVLESRGIRAGAIAPYSSGLYAAAFAAGVLDFETGLDLMAEAYRCIRDQNVPGGMGVVLGMSSAEVQQLCDAIPELVEVSIANTPHQTIVSGEPAGVEKLLRRAMAEEALKVDWLPASAPYHCSLLQGADRCMESVVTSIRLNSAHTPIFSYVDCCPMSEPHQMAQVFSNQLGHPVRWVGVVEELVRRERTPFVEIGPSQMLGRSVRWIHRPAQVLYTNTVRELEATIRSLTSVERP